MKSNSILIVLLTFITSAILLTVIQPPFNLSFLAWIALVPFIIGCRMNEKIWPTILAAYIISLCYWLGNLYWLILVTIPGGIAFCIYIALYWPILAVSLRYCSQRKIPLWFSLPVLIVGAEAFQGWIFKGFDWRYLGHSQYANITIIQIADIFGAGGISFLIAMVNGLVADLIIHSRKKQFLRSANLIGVLLTVLAVSAAIFYGRYRISQTADFLQAGPKIGVVQSNVPVQAGQEVEPDEISFLNLLFDSRDCLIKAKPQLIIWPETMVEAVLDDSYLKLMSEDDTAKIFHNALLRHSNEGVYLLIGAFASDAELADEKIKLNTQYNTAFLYEPNQTTRRQQYNKIHLVPFGEYIPFRNALPFLYRYLMALTPYDYDYTLNAGDEYTIFKIKAGQQTYKFGVMICYEDTVPEIAQKLTLGGYKYNKDKQIDWLVNISNDGWFVRQKKDKIKSTVELEQHMAICVFRAVENRVPIARSVNTGISCFIDSLGRIHNDYIAGSVAKQAANRTCQRGWFVDQVLIDKRVTFFSRVGQTLETSCAVCLIFAAFVSIYKLVDSR